MLSTPAKTTKLFRVDPKKSNFRTNIDATPRFSEQFTTPWNGICNPDSKLRTPDIPKFLFKSIFWIGLVEESPQKCLQRITTIFFILILIFMTASEWISCLLIFDYQDLGIVYGYLLNYLFISVVYISVFRRRNLLTTTLVKICEFSLPVNREKIINAIIFMLFSTPILYSAVKIIGEVNYYCLLYETYGYGLEDPTAQKVLISTKYYLRAIMHPIFTSLVALLLCVLCQRCCSLINILHQEIQHVSPEEFVLPKQLDILRRKAKIDEILDNIIDIFATPWLCIIIVTCLTCCIAIGKFVHFAFAIYRPADRNETVFCVITDCTCSIATLGVANRLSVRLKELKILFYKEVRTRQLFICNLEEPLPKKELFGKSNLVFIGVLEITRYHMRFVLVTCVAVLTYGLILIGMKKGESFDFDAYNISFLLLT
ncbi:uncharacterized protein TNIN_335761 [Trichonephila inaurata madagascariensis]|uniref:Uncharacterized protein n=1 Tax=Trichonephila inaurata madagascariensis TaxID=2747483 RepID=A0A8X6Y4S8_9ARAC|nr:uncharacterized protein TNIN_335761 [Trichonephila inaurata madagascariensis]